MVQDYRLEVDGSNLKQFMEHIDNRIGNDFMSSSNFKSERDSAEKLAVELAGSVDAIEKKMAISIIELGLEDFFKAADSWFYVEELRSMDKKSVSRKMSFGNNNSTNIYDNTFTLARDFDPGTMTDDGRFGKFFENIFFGGGAGNESVSDMVDERIEVKSKTQLKTDAKSRVFAKLKKDLQRTIQTRFPSGLAVGKVSSFRHVLNNLIQKGKYDEATLLARAIVLDKFSAKMDNFLMAFVDSGTSKDEKQWVFDPSTGFEKARYRMFFVKLYLYFHLIIEKVLKYVTDNIKIQKNVKPVGNFFKVRSDGKGTINKLEVNILQSMLPELEHTVNEGLITKIMENPTTFYSGLKVLYDDTEQNTYETSKDYFTRIINKYK